MSRQDDNNPQYRDYPPANQYVAQPNLNQTQYRQPRVAKQRRQLRLACLGCLLAMVSFFAIFVCILFVVGALVWNDYDQQLSEKLHQKEEEQSQAFQTAHVYDRRGNELHELFGEGRRTKIKITDIPNYLKDATIAVEDQTF